VRLAIHDRGRGCPLRSRRASSSPYFTTKPVGEGTGLGLATVHGIVKQSGGFIRVESEPGYGTTFELLFSRSSKLTSPSPEAVPLAPDAGGTVRLVEDDPNVRSVTARSLRSDSYAVLVAANGLEALEILSSHRGPLDLLVTDVIMPGVDGHRLAEAIKRQWPELSVLYVSGHAHDVLGERGALEPGIDLLPKPYTPATLLARVRAAVANLESPAGGPWGAARPDASRDGRRQACQPGQLNTQRGTGRRLHPNRSGSRCRRGASARSPATG
jgi:two-component system, cell cycle sensor histidine kinase and response regulator CckA